MRRKQYIFATSNQMTGKTGKELKIHELKIHERKIHGLTMGTMICRSERRKLKIAGGVKNSPRPFLHIEDYPRNTRGGGGY